MNLSDIEKLITEAEAALNQNKNEEVETLVEQAIAQLEPYRKEYPEQNHNTNKLYARALSLRSTVFVFPAASAD